MGNELVDTKKNGTELKIQDRFKSEFVGILSSEDFPVEVKEGIKDVVNIISDNKNLVDLYPEVLSEIPVSSSCFQDKCVQFEEHHTPHRKLRQCMLELQGKLDALDTSKNGYRKNLGIYEKVKFDIDVLSNVLEELDDTPDTITYDQYLAVFPYIPRMFNTEIIKSLKEYKEKKSHIFYISVKERVKNVLWKKMIRKDEVERNLNSSLHMVKDATIKVIQHQSLIKQYKKEVEDSGMCFELSEMVYYIMYFTSEIEKQLRTMGRIDTGTFGVIRYLPDGIRKKVLSNMNYIKQKLLNNQSENIDFITITDRDKLLPNIEGNCVEGVDIKEFNGMDPINLLSQKKEKKEE